MRWCLHKRQIATSHLRIDKLAQRSPDSTLASVAIVGRIASYNNTIGTKKLNPSF